MRVSLVPPLLALALRALARTWRVTRDGDLTDAPCVLAILHGEMLPIIGLHRDAPITMLASRSRDGEIVARVLARLGLAAARGSRSQGGREGLAELGQAIADGRIALVAVDGSRGPYGAPKPGAVVLAARHKAPVVALRAFAAPAIRLRSWDRFCIPLPFARVMLRYRRIEAPDDESDAIERALADLRAKLSDDTGPRRPDPLP